jgi:hypothetical protein
VEHRQSDYEKWKAGHITNQEWWNKYHTTPWKSNISPSELDGDIPSWQDDLGEQLQSNTGSPIILLAGVLIMGGLLWGLLKIIGTI